MPASLDLNYLPLISQPGEAAALLPGLHIASRPRRAARGRQDDRLIVYLTLEGNSFLAIERQDQLFNRLTQTYYKTPGSVTAALKNVAGALNQLLLERNLRAGSSGEQIMGVLNQLVVRDGRVYIAHCGAAHTFLIAATGAQYFHDPELSGRGLGLSKSAPIRYYQAELNPNDSLLVTPSPPTTWSVEFLTGLYGQGPEGLRRRLLEEGLEAALIQVKKGSGRVFLLRPKPGQPPAAPAAEGREAGKTIAQPELGSPGTPDQVISLPSHLPNEPLSKPVSGTVASTAVQPEPGEASPSGSVGQAVPEEGAAAAFEPPQKISPRSSAQPQPPGAVRRTPALLGLLRIWVRFSQQTANLTGRAAHKMAVLLSRMLPGEIVSGISSSVLAFFAIVVPLVVVAVATVIYFRSGRASQYEVYLHQAQQAVSVAQSQTDPRLERLAWENVLIYVDQAENYARSSETQTLRTQAGQMIDQLDGIRRLDFLPALNDNLPVEVQITHLAATDNELFMLNATDGSVLRAISVASGYDRDETFQCIPGITGGVNIGALIDFATLPKGNQLTAGLLAMDANGDMLNCEAGQDPIASQLQPPPTGFGKLKALALNLGNLYVLDPEKNAVWIYWKTQVDQEPELFFSEEIPPMADVIDMVVNEDDLYLLHADGHMTMCTYSTLGVSPTRCKDPIAYIDSRPGYENSSFINQDPFTEMLATQPPDPSLYTFEPKSHAIYQFSLRLLTLHSQYRPGNAYYFGSSTPANLATAFTISTDNRLAFIAVGNRVDFASLP
jgi:hypothetical protein